MGNLGKETYEKEIKVLLSEMLCIYIYGIRLCVIEIKISDKCKLEQKKSSFALTFYCKYVNIIC